MQVLDEHLIGDIKYFPRRVVQAMVDEQITQGNTADVAVFQKVACSTRYSGGFDWISNEQGEEFWSQVILDRHFHLIPINESNTKG